MYWGLGDARHGGGSTVEVSRHHNDSASSLRRFYSEAMTTLSDAAWSGLHAIVDRMVPADEFPSGWDAGVGDFIERMLAGDLSDKVGEIEAGLGAIDLEVRRRTGGRGLADLPGSEQDAFLTELSTHDSFADFIDVLARLCAQGFCGDPGNGGNRDEISWRMIGYRELPEGETWPTAEAAVGPTIGIAEVREQYDAIVVGAGAGGGVAASLLSEAGMTVLLIERGESLSSTDLRLDHLRSDRAITGYPRPTSGTPSGDPRVFASSTGTATVAATDARWGANAMIVGGGTRVFGAQAWRFCPEDFTMASIYGVPAGSSLADWPITYDDLAPWYDRAEWEMGVSGDPAGDRFAGPRSRGYPMRPVGRGSDLLSDAAARVGFLTGTVPLLINSEPFNGRPACVKCAACVGFACQAAAKNGSFNTVIPKALATGRCDLLTGFQVERLHTGEDGVVVGVSVVGLHDGDVIRRTITATNVVVAAGAIESARLLLNSATTREPDGLGNAHDQVGRHLQAHVYAGAIGLFDDVVQDGRGPGPNIATNDFRHRNPGIVGGGMIANDFVPTPLHTWDTLSRLGAIARFGARSKEGMRKLWSRTQLIFGPVQEVPTPDARIQLDPEVRDRFGVPVARLSGDIHPEDRRGARLLAERATEWLTAAGARTVIPIAADERPEGPSIGQHQAGTCRMGDDPRTSVTDRWGRVWGHRNVLVADGSVHVTNGGVNPVLTILALAYRNSSKLAEDWRAESIP
jgi:choline dehydrogenase-like flavoprotein